MLEPLTLTVSGLVSLWLAATLSQRTVPGSRLFAYVTLATAEWSLASVGQWAADSIAAKLLWAQLEYVGIVSIAPLLWAFAGDYAGAPWARRRSVMLATWIVPAATIAIALTNSSHHLLWTNVVLLANGGTVFGHGWWFWVIQGYSHILLLAATLLLARVVRRSPLYRSQGAALAASVLIPWAANVLYATDRFPLPGVDPTAPAFTLSGVLIAWALLRNRLFDLVPVARDHLVESLSDAVVVLDDDRRLLDMNAAARHLSIDTPVWHGQRVDEIMPVLADVPLHMGEASITLRAAVDGEPRWYDLRAIRVDAAGGPSAWVAQLRDITDERDAELERAAFEKRVHEQQRRESLSVLTGGLAHDFNNLLAGITGNADLLATQISPHSDMGTSVDAILLGAQKAADIVSKMLAYAGERHGASEMVDLDVVMREMLGLLRASAARHCTLNYSGRPVTIFADPVQVRQVALNLIINASEAVDAESGVIDVRVGSGELTSDMIASMRSTDDVVPGPYSYVEVRDNGQGMDPVTLSKIFTPFFTTKPGGHGLGLAAVQGIVRSHRGALHIETRKGNGCCFRVWFPEGPEPEAQGPRVESVRRPEDVLRLAQPSGLGPRA